MTTENRTRHGKAALNHLDQIAFDWPEPPRRGRWQNYNAQDTYRCLYLNVEPAQAARYGLGRRRTDLLVIWPYPGGEQREVIELKLLYKPLEETIAEGLEQTWLYMDRSGAGAGHLIIFDRRKQRSWKEKLFVRDEEYQGTTIKVWGM